MAPIFPGLHRLVSECEGFPFNIYVVEAGGLFAVDAGIAPTPAEVILPYLRDALGSGSLDLLAITHAHADHCGGAAALRQTFPALQIAATTQTGRWMGDHHANVCYSYGSLLEDWPLAEEEEQQFLALLGEEQGPTIRLNDGEGIPLGTQGALQLIATSGHCPGHAAFYWQARKLLFTGDALQGRGIPLGDSPLYLPVYDDVAAYADSLRRLLSWPFEWALPGHGDPLRPRELAQLVQESLDACAAIGQAVWHIHKRQPTWSLRLLTEAVCDRLGYPEVDVTSGMTVRAHLVSTAGYPGIERGTGKVAHETL